MTKSKNMTPDSSSLAESDLLGSFVGLKAAQVVGYLIEEVHLHGFCADLSQQATFGGYIDAALTWLHFLCIVNGILSDGNQIIENRHLGWNLEVYVIPSLRPPVVTCRLQSRCTYSGSGRLPH